ncbi:2-aminoadipate transaminase-like isoform X1 [Amphibalanus amphitrite]|uniref:2-aminoadipate transaminase-like isoform X1 n=2 Tax=Amphibalanus amphitrite TaxID=1232801 RepID=UPI001C91DE7E|nr:2-aminoadipate transaminase-like isoform X1 [Amphibalanus amphitrite]XP_043202051.1 2-aminoadipate transaminase-like isoform X1 [Amphibalanus amphitrite]
MRAVLPGAARGRSSAGVLHTRAASSKSAMTSPKDLEDLSSDANVLSLAYGGHNEDILNKAKELLAESTRHALEVEPPTCPNLNYGPQLGSDRFRSSLASFLSRRYGREVKSERLVLTCGATHALHLVTSQLFSEGGLVLVEEPSYYLALGLLKDDLGMRLVSVPLEEDGPNLALLEQQLTKLRAGCQFTPTPRRPFWCLMYLIPDHHNPTGASISEEKRRGLVELARRFDVLLFCDDVYNLLTYPPARVGPLLITYDHDSPPTPGVTPPTPVGHVVSAGTFSKICAPGVRVGWLEAPPRMIEILSESKILFSGGAVNGFMSSVMASAIQLGLLDKHLDGIIAVLQEKLELTLAFLGRTLPPERYQWSVPCGGFYVWLCCPFDTVPFAAWCEKNRGVLARAGAAFSVNGSGCQHHLRISISYLSRDTLQEALSRLCDALLEYEAEHGGK